MLPLVAIVGRPNVGKSTLFNRFTGSRRALVLPEPGITRDRQYRKVEWDGSAFNLVDTAGIELHPQTPLQKKMTEAAMQGVEEADLVLVMMDGRAGLTTPDREWIEKMRRVDRPKIFLVNKVDGPKQESLLAEFYELGVEPLMSISAETGRGAADVLDRVVEDISLTLFCPGAHWGAPTQATHPLESPIFKLALIGRPNVGKSTLLNRLLGKERALVDATPGTTRDPVDSFLHYDNQIFRIMDTAGIRKKGKTGAGIEKLAAVKSLKVIDRCNLALVLLDGMEGLTDQDAHVAGYAHANERAMIYLVNKWDEGVKKGTEAKFYELLQHRFGFSSFAPVLFISARTGKNVDRLFPLILKVKAQYEKRISTAELNEVFERIIEAHPLPVFRGRNIKICYVTQIAALPPTFVIFSNEPKKIHFSYERYLINSLRDELDLGMVPLRIIFRKK